MSFKEVAVLIIFCIFILPLLVKTAIFSLGIGSNTPEETTDQAAELITEATIPWWFGILTWLASLGTLGTFLIVIFIIFLKSIKEIN